MPGVPPVGANLGGVHQGLVDRQLRDPIVLAGLVNQADHLLPYFQVIRQSKTFLAGGILWGGGSSGADSQHHGFTLPGAVKGGNLRTPLRLGDGNPEGQHLLDRYRFRVAGGDGVLCSAGLDDEAAPLSDFQGAALVTTYPDGRGWCFCCCGGKGEYNRKGSCYQRGDAFFMLVILFPPVFSIFWYPWQPTQYRMGGQKSIKKKNRNREISISKRSIFARIFISVPHKISGFSVPSVHVFASKNEDSPQFPSEQNPLEYSSLPNFASVDLNH